MTRASGDGSTDVSNGEEGVFVGGGGESTNGRSVGGTAEVVSACNSKTSIGGVEGFGGIGPDVILDEKLSTCVVG